MLALRVEAAGLFLPLCAALTLNKANETNAVKGRTEARTCRRTLGKFTARAYAANLKFA